MKQWTHDEFCRMAERNGYYLMRSNGSHSIYVNSEGHHMSIPYKLACVIARRLIKENNLNIVKRKKKMNDNYPPGAANDPNAPYNEIELPKREFNVTVSQTLSRSTKVSTDQYIPVYDYDEDMGTIETYDTSNTNWKEVYENEDFKVQELISILKSYVENDIKNTLPKSVKGRYLARLLKACDGWVEDDYEVIED